MAKTLVACFFSLFLSPSFAQIKWNWPYSGASNVTSPFSPSLHIQADLLPEEIFKRLVASTEDFSLCFSVDSRAPTCLPLVTAVLELITVESRENHTASAWIEENVSDLRDTSSNKQVRHGLATANFYVQVIKRMM